VDKLAKGHKGCPFCMDRENSRIISLHGTVAAIKDKYPVSEYHTLVIPLRHTRDFFTMTPQERRDMGEILETLRREIMKKDPSVTGFNVGVNCGLSAGQTLFHAHIHLIPRRDGDTPYPRGGVRGVIPDKMSY